MAIRLFPLPALTVLALAGLALASCEAPDESGGSGSSAAGSPAAAAGESASAEGSGADGESEEEASAGLVFTESGWLTVGADGGVQTTFIDAGGRYRDLRNGEQVAEGKWQERPDGSLCFEPDAGFGACWEIEPLEDDGTAIAVNGEGKRIEIKRVSYIGPEASEDDDTDAES